MGRGNPPEFPGVVLVRYGELFLKSEPVKRQFTGALLRNMGAAMESEGLVYTCEVHRGRILVHGPDPGRIAAVLSRVFGVVEVAVAVLTPPDPEEIAKAALGLAAERLSPGMTFAVRARRQGVEGITSQELGAITGSRIYDAIGGLRVNLDSPDYEVFVELREFGGLVYDHPVPAPGGLPWGTQGPVISLLSSGIDSPVASWLMMKRGCIVEHLHFDGGAFAGSDVLSMALRHHATLSGWCRGYPFILNVCDAEFFYRELVDKVPPRYRCVLCKRFMFRVGSLLAEQRGALALVTGDNLGQVASQTLPNMAAISGAAGRVPVLRPLIANDKNDTITMARKIGTFRQERQGDLGCRAVPGMPATKTTSDELERLEKRLGMDDLVAGALSRCRQVTARNGEIAEDGNGQGSTLQG
ncbi:thiamine biosynthesis protein ThiI [Methanolinea mesophila]|uniref:tRNA sulfurtransferase n=1 Tax=Methanolinea mesophila TaxID=547055 RepID=UPI001AE876D6|nr:tRNA sulfurtransferase [Methanolinea mesophila]MBP1929823.1 thiamine biosynthesis protein ThiI [Methanolinea mesophila]